MGDAARQDAHNGPSICWNEECTMLMRRWMWIVWPAFLAAGLMEVLVFAFVDPQELTWLGQPADISRLGVCSIAFFLFWGIAMLASGMTCLLSLSARDLNETGSQAASA